MATSDPGTNLRAILDPGEPARPRQFGKKPVTPRSPNQRRYMEEIERNDMVFAIGPGGTGKTYLAVAMAVSALLAKQVHRIILARPAVEAGERLGFLPGTLQQKIDPYMRPLYDAIYDMLDADKLDRFLDKGVIEVAPLAFMRGRTLNDSFVILDEAQNTTSEQMKMFLTRLGFNSKAVITGDVTQIDLPSGRRSGLVEAIEVVGKIEGIGFVYFNERDVVRHNLVQQIVKAYDEYGASGKPVLPVRAGERFGRAARFIGMKAVASEMVWNRQRRVPVDVAPLERFAETSARGTGFPGGRRGRATGERRGHEAAEPDISREARVHGRAVVSGATRPRAGAQPAAAQRERERKRIRRRHRHFSGDGAAQRAPRFAFAAG